MAGANVSGTNSSERPYMYIAVERGDYATCWEPVLLSSAGTLSKDGLPFDPKQAERIEMAVPCEGKDVPEFGTLDSSDANPFLTFSGGFPGRKPDFLRDLNDAEYDCALAQRQMPKLDVQAPSQAIMPECVYVAEDHGGFRTDWNPVERTAEGAWQKDGVPFDPASVQRQAIAVACEGKEIPNRDALTMTGASQFSTFSGGYPGTKPAFMRDIKDEEYAFVLGGATSSPKIGDEPAPLAPQRGPGLGRKPCPYIPT